MLSVIQTASPVMGIPHSSCLTAIENQWFEMNEVTKIPKIENHCSSEHECFSWNEKLKVNKAVEPAKGWILDHPFIQGDQIRNLIKINLSHQVLAMEFDRSFADTDLSADLFICLALNQPIKDLPFAICED